MFFHFLDGKFFHSSKHQKNMLDLAILEALSRVCSLVWGPSFPCLLLVFLADWDR